MIVINLKSYKESSGKKAERIADYCKELSTAKVPIVLAPSAYDLSACSSVTRCFSEHADALDAHRNTGFLPVELAKMAGAKGSIINHSEHRLPEAEIKKAKKMLDSFSMKCIICVKDDKEAAKYASLKPYAIAVEPPKLIAGKISISSAKPELITHTVDAIKKKSPKTKVLIGAGIHNSEDVRQGLSLGAEGVLVASGIALAKNPRSAIKELMKGYSKK